MRGSRKPAGIGEVARLPDRIELLLVGAQPLEVVERFAVVVEEGAEPVPQRRDRRAPRSPTAAPCRARTSGSPASCPTHQVDEQRLHHALAARRGGSASGRSTAPRRPAPGQRLANATIRPLALDRPRPESARGSPRRRSPSEKPFSAPAFCRQPVVGDRAQLRQDAPARRRRRRRGTCRRPSRAGAATWR